jgi:hypothetical protein
MIVGLLLICIDMNCQAGLDYFETMEACEIAGTEAVESLPSLYPQITSLGYKCEIAGEPV